MPFDVQGDQRLDGGAAVGVKVTAGLKLIGQAMRLVERPRLEGGHELHLADQAVLKGEQSEEKLAVGSGGHTEAPGHDIVLGTTGHGTSPRPGCGKCRIETIIAFQHAT